MSNAHTRGFSLVELLLALTLGLILIAGLVRLFSGSSQSYALVESVARLQESGRYALAIIGRSARNAGFLGCNGGRGPIVNTLNGDLDTLFQLNVSRPVDAFDDDGGGSSAAFALAAGIDHSRIVAGTDMVAFRGLASPLYRVADPVDPDANPVVEGESSFGLQTDDFLLIGDCEQASMFRLTGVTGSVGRMTLLRGRGTGALENSPVKPLSEGGKVYGDAAGATVGRVLTETYFVARGRGLDRNGAPISSLWRREGASQAAELVEGIGDLQLSFGVDTRPQDGVAAVNRLSGFDDIPAGAVIRAVNVLVVAVDTSERRTFSQTFSLRNAR